MGFKHAHPSHPCKKCWSKFAKTFLGPVAYDYSSDGGIGIGRNTFQRPLPAFRSPRSSRCSRRMGSRSAPAPTPVPVPASIFDSSRLEGTPFCTLSPYPRAPPLGMGGGVRNSDAVVSKVGDPCLGGTLCWRCEGTGMVSLLNFDETTRTCDVCDGIGRVFSEVWVGGFWMDMAV